jgi:imidazolonepropionase-like amidohydrolase
LTESHWGAEFMRKSRILAGILAAAALAGTQAAAQTMDVHAGRLIDPASARVLTDQRIRVVDGRIAAVTPWRDGDGPASVDWSAETVLPGLIDLHTHIADGAIDEHANDPAEPLKHSEAATILR